MVYQNLGLLILTVHGIVTSNPSIMAEVKIDGRLTYLTYGQTQLWLEPGPHRLEFASRWLLRHGFATTEIDVPPGGVVQLYYAGPFHIFCRRGAVGPVPQQRPGVAEILWFLGIVGAVMAVVAVVLVILES